MQWFKNFVFIFFALVCLSSCVERGCTDESALNYNITATSDDGSCIYCSSNNSALGNMTFEMTDFVWGSPYYNQSVLEVTAKQEEIKYNDGGCGDNRCVVSLSIKNMTTQDIDGLYFNAYINPVFGVGYSYTSEQNVAIPANESIEIPNAAIRFISTGSCGSITNATGNSTIYSINYN